MPERGETMNKSEQSVRSSQVLSDKQTKIIVAILQSRTIAEGCRKAKISRETFYEWLKDETFKAEFEKQRREIIDLSLHELKTASREAVDVLRGLLISKKDGIRFRAATTIIENVIKSLELEDLNKRIEALEKLSLKTKGGFNEGH